MCILPMSILSGNLKSSCCRVARKARSISPKARWWAAGWRVNANAINGSPPSAPHRPRCWPWLAAAGTKDHLPSHGQREVSGEQTLDGHRLVVDGKLITSLAAGSAMEFAYEIVRQLRGSDAVSKVNHGVHAVV